MAFPAPTFNTSAWSHLCFTKDNDGQWALYLNSSLIEQGTDFQTSLSFHDGSLIIGQKKNKATNEIDPDRYFIGKVTQFRVWPYSMTHMQIGAMNGKCLDDYGTIPWSEAYLWKDDSVNMYNISFCKSFKGEL